MTSVGIDLGGTNLRAAAFDGTTMRAQHREPVGEPRDPATVVASVARVVEQLAPDGGDVGVGIAAMLRDRRGTVANSPHLHWRDVPFGELLATRLGARYRIGVYNDVNAITWGEVCAGAARGCRDVLGVFVGTGIGAGVVCNGALVEGASNCAGEIGHTKVRWDDRAEACACGQRGCIEAYIGGSYLQRRIVRELSAPKARFGYHAAPPPTSVLTYSGGIEHVTPSHVDRAAGEGDAWALALWGELAPLLAIAIGNAVAVLNPERVVFGGGVLAHCPTLFELVATALEISAPTASLEPLDVVAAELGDDAGLVGAAQLITSSRR